MDEGQKAWESHTARTIPHLEAAMARASDHGVPVDKAAFLGLVYFSGLLLGTCRTQAEVQNAAQEVRFARDAVFTALSEIADRAEANAG